MENISEDFLVIGTIFVGFFMSAVFNFFITKSDRKKFLEGIKKSEIDSEKNKWRK